MKKQIYLTIAISGVLLLLSSTFNSCIQEGTFSKATIETNQVTSVTEATANCGGVISGDGGSNVTARGVCWSTSPNPTIENDTTIDAAGTGLFSSLIKGLSPSTTYYVRAYAVNKGGVGYGLQMAFTTKTYSITTTPISVSFITATSAIGGGNIISDGDSSTLTVKARGVCWNTFPTPTIANSITTDGVGGGRFTSNMDSLTAFTTYYVRAYATNDNVTIYGNEVSFTTLNGVVGITTNAVSSITAYTANCSGTIMSDGGATVTERGLCWNTSPNPSTANIKTVNVSGTSTFNANITGLTPSTTYYVRTYAINSVGTSYGNEVSFLTQSGIVGLTTTPVSSILAFTATSGGTITTDGGALVTQRGICWNTSTSPTTANNKTANGAGAGTFTSNITGLTMGTTYYIRSYGINSVGTSYGNEVSFTTQSGVIGLTTSDATSITPYTATSGGTITTDGGAPITERGLCWNTSPNPITANNKKIAGSGLYSFLSSMTSLSANTLYYVRSYAINSLGTSYGNNISFTTLSPTGTVTDLEGNVYNYITIGTMSWMVENLKTTKYRNGESIGTTTPAAKDISSESGPKYQWAYGGDEGNVSKYGRLYTWYTVNDSRKIAPIGWHVATDAEWTSLENYLIANGYNYDGTNTGNKVAKSLAATSGWKSDLGTGVIGNDLTKNNTSGFAGLPGGGRDDSEAFYGVGNYGNWWSSTGNYTSDAWSRYLYYYYSNIGIYSSDKQSGFSVRCVLDY